MKLIELKINIDNEILNINESVSDTLLNIKKYIKEFISSNKNDMESVFPRFKKYLVSLDVSKSLKKSILVFAAMLLFSNGFASYSQEIKDIVKSETSISKNFSYEYEIGEYKIDKNIIKDYILSKMNGSSMNGTITVTISSDPNNPNNKNFANDDSDIAKKYGGKLLQKRISEMEKVISEIQSEVLPYIINIDIKGDESDKREVIFTDIQTNNDKQSGKTEVSKKSDKTLNDISKIGGGLKDITDLSRNYQFVELLSVGGINAQKFDNNDVDKGDIYSKWIVNTRKRVKDLLFRLADEYPEYQITFNTEAKSFTPFSGTTTKGKSNIRNQYKFVESFESFSNKGDVLKKWKRILGSSFPDLNQEIATKFDENIIQFLEYLDQMYGGTSLEFSFKR